MKQKQIFKITYTVTDRGETWTPQPIETNDERNHQFTVKKYLSRWRVALDLSPKYTFKIISAVCVGYGFV